MQGIRRIMTQDGVGTSSRPKIWSEGRVSDRPGRDSRSFKACVGLNTASMRPNPTSERLRKGRCHWQRSRSFRLFKLHPVAVWDARLQFPLIFRCAAPLGKLSLCRVSSSLLPVKSALLTSPTLFGRATSCYLFLFAIILFIHSPRDFSLLLSVPLTGQLILHSFLLSPQHHLWKQRPWRLFINKNPEPCALSNLYLQLFDSLIS